jgi:predicted Fe-Mo cluster-binding NifX family protein
MKVAIPHWQGRVSPVFDVAGHVLLVDVQDGRERARTQFALDASGPQARAARLAEAGADVLICGAISWPLEMAVSSAGIEVIPQTCGEVERVLAAFVAGRLRQDEFLMPGCCGRRRRFHGGGPPGRGRARQPRRHSHWKGGEENAQG